MGVLSQVLGQSQRVQFVQNSTATVIQFDASLKEIHSRKSTPTKFPIENGNNISDHIVLEPFNLELTGIITDTPLSGVQQLLTEVTTAAASALIPPIGVIGASAAYALFKALSNSKSPSVAAYSQLLLLQSNEQPFDVITSLYRYPSMWISNITVPRDVDTGKALVFTVSLEQLLLVSPQSVNIQIFANPGLAANQADLGQQGLNIPNGFQQGQRAFDNLAGGGI